MLRINRLHQAFRNLITMLDDSDPDEYRQDRIWRAAARVEARIYLERIDVRPELRKSLQARLVIA